MTTNWCSQAGPTIDLMLCCHHLELLLFGQGALHFHFALGAKNYITSLGARPQGGATEPGRQFQHEPRGRDTLPALAPGTRQPPEARRCSGRRWVSLLGVPELTSQSRATVPGQITLGKLADFKP